jgi:hypothetical protein
VAAVFFLQKSAAAAAEPLGLHLYSPIYYLYRTYFLGSIIYTVLPISLLTIFGILTYRNIKSVRHVNPLNTMATPNLVIVATFNISRIVGEPNNDERFHVAVDQRQKQKTIINKQRIDGQFSIILILQVLCFSIATVPECITFIYSTVTANYVKIDMSQAIEGLFTVITYVMCFLPFCSSFYIYYLSSAAYRRNVKKILLKKI